MEKEHENSILIVDDDSSNIMKLTHILSPDYTIYAATNGLTAINAAEKYLPDMVLLDIIMPDMSGYDVITVLKKTDKTKNIPVIFVTGLNEAGEEEKGFILGASDYITKPFNSAIVKQRVLNQIKILNQMRTIERISMIDLLTDLPNRRSFEARLNVEWMGARREQKPLSFLIIDVDEFKKYNDTFGHQQGDVALQTLGKVLTETLRRSTEFAARWGGEEFVVLLPNTDSYGALVVAERIRKNIEETNICLSDTQTANIAVSIGVNTWTPSVSCTVDELISGADNALYNAKKEGRNRVCHFKNTEEIKSDDKRKTIFIVDDSAANLSVAEEALGNQYRVVALSSAAQMFSMLEKLTPDLILLDIEMPDADGFEAMRQLRKSSSYFNIPVIFLTGLHDSATEAYGIEQGATDFIMKPFSKPVLLNRIKNHLQIDTLIRNRTKQLVERTGQLERLKNSIVYTLADIVESRDVNTGGHIDRTTKYMEILVRAMIARKIYADEMRDWNIESVIASARLHDVGKIVISDTILNKPGSLTSEEFQTMKTHVIEGNNIIDRTMIRAGDEDFLQNAKLFAAFHHEKWDGTGYSQGLSGEDIPLQGRIMAVIDVYDALVSDRPYKKAFTHEESVKIIKDGAGSHFDPRIAEVFCAVNDEIKATREEIALTAAC